MSNREKRSMPGPRQINRNLTDERGVINKKDAKKNWKLLKERLKQHRANTGSAWTSTVPVPASDVPLHPNNNRYMTRPHNVDAHAPPPVGADLRTRSGTPHKATMRTLNRGESARFDNSIGNIGGEDANEVDRGGLGYPEPNSGGLGGEKKVRMSLMALLAETDREMGIDGSSYMMGDDDEEDEEEYEDEDEDVHEIVEGVSNCCVCKVRHNGSASTPCGHTFCKLCSKEINVVQQGNCPQCNSFILEIIDIF